MARYFLTQFRFKSRVAKYKQTFRNALVINQSDNDNWRPIHLGWCSQLTFDVITASTQSSPEGPHPMPACENLMTARPICIMWVAPWSGGHANGMAPSLMHLVCCMNTVKIANICLDLYNNINAIYINLYIQIRLFLKKISVEVFFSYLGFLLQCSI